MILFFTYRSLKQNAIATVADLHQIRGTTVAAYNNKAITKEQAAEVLSMLFMSCEEIEKVLS